MGLSWDGTLAAGLQSLCNQLWPLGCFSWPCIELSPQNFEPHRERSCGEKRREKQTQSIGEEKPLLKKLRGDKCKTFPTPMLWFCPEIQLSIYATLGSFGCRQGCLEVSSPTAILRQTNLRPFSEVWSHFGFHGAACWSRKCGSLKSDKLGFVSLFSYLLTYVISVTCTRHLISPSFHLLIHQMGILTVNTWPCSPSQRVRIDCLLCAGHW